MRSNRVFDSLWDIHDTSKQEKLMELNEKQQQALDKFKMFHLTTIGPNAGAVLCGADKQMNAKDGSTFYHAVYCPLFIMQSQKICPDCKAIWES